MAMKDITDVQVVLAVLEARAGDWAEWPYQILERRTGQPEKVCFRAMERAEGRGYLDCGVSLRAGWATPAGLQLVRDELERQGASVPPELEQEEARWR